MPGEFWAAVGTILAAMLATLGIIIKAILEQKPAAAPAVTPGVPVPQNDALLDEIKSDRDYWRRCAQTWQRQLLQSGIMPDDVIR